MGKRVVLIAGICGFILGSIWLTHMIQTDSDEIQTIRITLPDEAARTKFLQTQGFEESVCVATETVRIPVCVDDAYKTYAALQESQNLPLTAHLGETAVRYTYKTKAAETVCAELLLDENQTLLGAVSYDSRKPAEITAAINGS